MDLCKQIQAELHTVAEEKYRRFEAALLPGTENLLGVRLPILRKIAARLCKGDWEDFLAHTNGETFEERMLEGFVLAAAPMETEKRLNLIEAFLPKIDNWSVCDSFCSSLKCVQEAPKKFLALTRTALESDAEYTVRFGVVLLLWYYIDDSHITEILSMITTISHPGYYARMAIAWCLASCHAKFPVETEAVLTAGNLDTFTHNKAIQKIKESRLTPPDVRERLQALRRPVSEREESPCS